MFRRSVGQYVVIDDHFGELIVFCEPVTFFLCTVPKIRQILKQRRSPQLDADVGQFFGNNY